MNHLRFHYKKEIRHLQLFVDALSFIGVWENLIRDCQKKEVVDLDNLSPDEMKAMLKRMLSQS